MIWSCKMFNKEPSASIDGVRGRASNDPSFSFGQQLAAEQE
jgi:hypothetical protein